MDGIQVPKELPNDGTEVTVIKPEFFPFLISVATHEAADHGEVGSVQHYTYSKLCSAHADERNTQMADQSSKG